MAIDSTSGDSRDPFGLETRRLRATIRERGSLRFLVTQLHFRLGGGSHYPCAVTVVPTFILVPLVLAAGFE